MQAVIYDMDGVLIDSEPLWRKVEIKSLGTVGVTLTNQMCKETTGLRIDEVVEYWRMRFPWEGVTNKEVEELISSNIIQLIKDEGEPKVGVRESLEYFTKNGLKIGLASTSTMELIHTVLEKFEIKQYFGAVHSAQLEKYGKPHPAVYITTAKKLDVNPVTCMAIEDSINGMIAAKAARMKCIGIPEKEMLNDKRLGVADLVVTSLLDINDDLLK